MVLPSTSLPAPRWFAHAFFSPPLLHLQLRTVEKNPENVDWDNSSVDSHAVIGGYTQSFLAIPVS